MTEEKFIADMVGTFFIGTGIYAMFYFGITWFAIVCCVVTLLGSIWECRKTTPEIQKLMPVKFAEAFLFGIVIMGLLSLFDNKSIMEYMVYAETAFYFFMLIFLFPKKNH